MKPLAASLLLALFGCGPAISHNDSTLAAPGTYLITAEQIEKSGALRAWQILREKAPMLTMREDRNGRPASMSRRGQSSFVLDEAPMMAAQAATIMLDGVRVPDFHALESIDARSIFTILIYDGVEGTTYYGTNAASGVVVIKTKDGRQS